MQNSAIIMIIILSLGASVSAGSVANSSHNLSSEWFIWGEHPVNNYNEVCVYCHTPHNATTTIALWNRQLRTPATYTPYASSTLQATPGLPSVSARLCLSCHDGTIALDAVANVGSSTVEYSTDHAKMNDQWCGINCHLEGNSTYIYDTGLNLSDDHPVSIEYIESPELKPRPADGQFANGVKLVDGKVECVSCHDAHDPTISGRYFLRLPNSGSALCYTCHDK